MLSHQYIYLIHVLFVGPLLMYPYVMKYECKESENYFLAIFYIGLVVVLYHSHKLLKLNNII